MTSTEARLVVISPSELADGFRLTGVDTVEAETPPQAEETLRRLLKDGERGVIAVYGPLFEGIDAELQRRLKASVAPVVVEIPTGMDTQGDELRRSRLARRLEQAIGYHVSFGEDTP